MAAAPMYYVNLKQLSVITLTLLESTSSFSLSFILHLNFLVNFLVFNLPETGSLHVLI